MLAQKPQTFFLFLIGISKNCRPIYRLDKFVIVKRVTILALKSFTIDQTHNYGQKSVKDIDNKL